jgi:hypothetical protein
MGHEDRERNFEQALARYLRSQSARELEGAADGCPDATMLAAFHERMLSSEEMNFTKAHVAACSRCQEILASLEATDEVEVLDEEIAAKPRASILSTGALYVDYATRQVPVLATAARPASSMKAPRDISAGRRATWKWMAPAGALAAGLLVWIVARESKPLSVAPASKIEVAQEQAAARYTEDQLATTPMKEHPEIAKPLDDAQKSEARKPGFDGRRAPGESRDARGGAAGGIVGGAKPDAYTSALQQREAQNDALKELAQRRANANMASNLEKQNNEPFPAAAPPAPAKPPEPGDKKAQSSPATAAASSGDRSVADASSAGGNLRESGKDINSLNKQKSDAGAGTATVSRAKAGAPSSAAAGKTAANKNADALPVQGRNTAEGTEKKEADQGVTVTTMAQAEVSSKDGRAVALQNGNVGEPTILTPGGTVLWRLQPRGKIERSVDSGITWSRQSSGVTTELLAGSAPSDAVCWIVGSAGTILRTTDGGGHWSRVVSPIAGNVGGIRAVDAMHATIFGAGGESKSGGFATSDGGVTWTPVAE